MVVMADYTYVLTQERLKKFLAKIQTAGTPDKATIIWLESLGFKGKNDRRFLPVMKFLGLVGENRIPTEKYSRFKSKKAAGVIMASCIKDAYSDLYSTYASAHKQSPDSLNDWFASRTKVAEATRNHMVNTFLTLAGLADFEGKVPPDIGEVEDRKPKDKVISPVGRSITLNLNIQLQLPATQDQEIYEKLFAAMGKYLLGSES